MFLRTAITTGLTAAALAAASLPSLADDVTLSTPIQAGSLNEGGIDMVSYYVPQADGAVHVVATYVVANDATAVPARLIMRLEDGEGTTFSLPGHLDTVFGFSREGDEVSITANPVEAKTASL